MLKLPVSTNLQQTELPRLILVIKMCLQAGPVITGVESDLGLLYQALGSEPSVDLKLNWMFWIWFNTWQQLYTKLRWADKEEVLEREDSGPAKLNMSWLLQEMWLAWGTFGGFLISAIRTVEVNMIIIVCLMHTEIILIVQIVDLI